MADGRLRAAGVRVYPVLLITADATRLPQPDTEPTDDEPAVLDTGGGTGIRFPWRLLAGGAPAHTFIAGGVRPDNVACLLAYRPWGIDLASGVESAPGIKQPAAMAALFASVAAARTEP